jgi:methylthioribose-1-phosphate isomerase
MASPPRTLDWDGQDVVAIDQTLLPGTETLIRLHEVDELAEAIRSLRIRGAMGLGVAGGLGLALAIRRAQERNEDAVQAAEAAAVTLAATRPTAANLFWGIEHVRAVLRDGPEAAVAAAAALVDADVAANLAIAERGAAYVLAELFADDELELNVLTHCNAGALAGVEIGTALGVIGALHRRGRVAEAIACETRPLLQGARLTCWELQAMGIACSLIVDSAAAGLIARRTVDLVIVGADRIAANGDVANKVGTFSHALAARHAGIPFIVAAPEATIDLACESGADIPIEERSADEVTRFAGLETAPAGMRALNPAFDVTPAELVTAIVTEQRVIRIGRGERPLVAEPLVAG